MYGIPCFLQSERTSGVALHRLLRGIVGNKLSTETMQAEVKVVTNINEPRRMFCVGIFTVYTILKNIKQNYDYSHLV